MKVLVTGATGMIGQHLIRRLVEHPDITQIVGVSRNAEKPYDGQQQEKYNLYESHIELKRWTDRLLADFKPDVIYHLAGVSTAYSNPEEIWRSNVDTTFNLLSSLKQSKDTIFINMSSIVVQNFPLSLYGASKLASEALVNSYTQIGKINGINLRPCAVVGKGLTHGLLKDILIKLNEEKDYIELLGDCPGSRKPYLYIEDLLNIMMNWVDYKNLYVDNFISISPGDTLTVEQVAFAVMDVLNYYKPIKWLGNNSNWVGDQKTIFPVGTRNIYGSKLAVMQAVKDIIND